MQKVWRTLQEFQLDNKVILLKQLKALFRINCKTIPSRLKPTSSKKILSNSEQ
jgi:hypothetical protein